MKTWLSLHPYTKAAQSDFYYLRLCNDVADILFSYDYFEIELDLSDDKIKDLACFLTAYFEDVISGVGLWKAFTQQHLELYDTCLPFFIPDEYYQDEINPEDIMFLLWYYSSMVLYEERILSPAIFAEAPPVIDIFDLFFSEYEQAPENLKLKQIMEVAPDEEDFFRVRDRLRWILLDSWLLHFSRLYLEQIIEDVLDDGTTADNLETYATEIADTFLFTSYTPLLAVKGKNWLAYSLGSGHPLFNNILDISVKIRGFFLFLGYEDNNLLFQHVTTDTRLRVTAWSLEMSEDWRAGESIFLIGFVKWKEKWWFSGTYAKFGYDQGLIENVKASDSAGRLFGLDPVLLRKAVEEQNVTFLKYNKGKPIAFLGSQEEAGRFVQEYLIFHNEQLDISDNQRKEALEKIQMISEQKSLEKKTEVPDSVPGLVYFNPASGIELAFGFNKLIPEPDNPWYMGPDADEDAMRLLYSQYISKECLEYILEHEVVPGLGFPGEGGQKLLTENLDFMIRFWKKKHYHSES